MRYTFIIYIHLSVITQKEQLPTSSEAIFLNDDQINQNNN